jgi:DNA-3-methyladenine glycosylase
MKKATLPASFYRRDTGTVARELLGMRLFRRFDDGRIFSGTIVETEAYLGITDRACHTFGGRRTPRTETMYGTGGIAYVYLIYGMYYCLNAVTKNTGEPEAVLIRALQVDAHDEAFWREKYPRLKTQQWMSGPGRLCRALALDKSHNGLVLQSDALWIARGHEVAQEAMVAAPRIGVDYAGAAAQWPLRFYVSGSAAVSRR